MKKLLMIVALVMLAGTQAYAQAVTVALAKDGYTFWFGAWEFWAVKDKTGQYLDAYIKVGMKGSDVGSNKYLLESVPDLWRIMIAREANSDDYVVSQVYDKMPNRNERTYPSHWAWGFTVTKIRTGPRSQYE